MIELINSLGTLSPTLASIIVLAGLYFFLIKNQQEDRKRQQEKDEAYITTLTSMQASILKTQADMDNNWKVTQDISKNVSSVAQSVAEVGRVLNSIKCLK